MRRTASSTIAVCCVVAATLWGCSAHDPFILTNTTDVRLRTAAARRPHNQKVLFLDSPLPATVKYEVIAQIDAGRIWYGSSESVLDQIADKARELGADAVVDVRTWHQPSGFSWSAPHGRGTAVRILDRPSTDLSRLRGQWR